MRSIPLMVYVYIYMKYVSATEGKRCQIPLCHLEAASDGNQPQYIEKIGKTKNRYFQVELW